MPQKMVGQHQRHHRLADRHRANADAGIVTALRHDLDVRDPRGRSWRAASGSMRSASPRNARRSAGRWKCRRECRRRGWTRNSGAPSLPMRISSALSSPDRAAAAKPAPISTPFTALIDMNARGEVRIELAVDRRTPSGRHAFGDDLDDRADRRAGLAHAVEVVFPVRGGLRVGTEERVVARLPPSRNFRDRSHGARSARARRARARRRMTFAAIAPAATRAAVSRAEERPPPR